MADHDGLMGRQAGEAAMLRRLLERRFSLLPGTVAERIETADAATLEEWGPGLFEAESLDDVLR